MDLGSNPTRRCYLLGLFLLSCNAFLGSCQKPNFIVMIMDDMGWGDLGVHGNPNKETPNIDQMASQGMLFTEFYTGAPLCSPSRAALLTGRLPVRNGFYTDNAHGRNGYTPQDIMGGIADNEILLPEILSKNGYRTKLVGKWHLGHRSQYLPLKHGFHEYVGSTNCHFGPYNNRDTPNIPVFRDDEMIGRYYEDFDITPNGESNITSFYLEEALSFIRRFENSTQPFFLYWAPDNMHGPVYASSAFVGTSPKGRYGDAIREADFGVGQILKALQETHLDKRTLVFFMSDNGPALVDKANAGSAGPFLCGKQTTFEGGMRVPGVAWWPSVIKPGQVSHQLVSITDIFVTALDLIKMDLPKDRTYDGISLKATLKNANQITDRSIFFYRGNELFAVRHGWYKLHLWTWTNSLEELHSGIDFCPGQEIVNITTHIQTNHTSIPALFHLGRDPSERYPISAESSEYKEQLPIFREMISAHRANLTFAKPQLNWCDNAVQHWAPPGCRKLKRCLPQPKSKPHLCDWPH